MIQIEPRIKAWTEGVEVEASALQQLQNVASLPIVGPYLAVMPDVHWGMGATVGSVIPTRGAIIPAAVGVDLGCGMMAVQTGLDANVLDGRWAAVRAAIENAVPVGGPGVTGSWAEPRFGGTPRAVMQVWGALAGGYTDLVMAHPKLAGVQATQLGTLGTGNHFIEVCRDQADRLWLMLHSGSRGVGNRIGTYFIARAREHALRLDRTLPDRDLAWLDEGTADFDAYVTAVRWAQRYARLNREVMMNLVAGSVGAVLGVELVPAATVVNCHHNYVQEETHFGERVWLTRKGAVSARAGELGIIPGSMGARSYIVRGKGHAESFHSCSHGAGRRLSRGAAKRTITLQDHVEATAGVECRKDAAMLDESPAAYKDIDAVMAAQSDLVEVVATLKQLVCVKG